MNLFFQDEDQRNAISPMEVDFQDPNFLEAMAERTAQMNPFTQQQALQAVAPQQFGAPQIPQGGTPPFNPNAPYPRQQQQQGGLSGFLNSPGLAMASQAANNIFAARKDQAIKDPVQVYQQAVQNQAIMKMREAQDKREAGRAGQQRAIGEQTIEMNEQKLDPFYEYNEAKRTGVIDPNMTYAEFQRLGLRGTDLTSPIKNFAHRGALEEAVNNAKTPEEKKAAEEALQVFDNYVRAPQVVGIGGGGNVRVGAAPGQQEMVVTPEAATLREGVLAGTKEAATQESKTSAQQVNEGMAGARSARNMFVSADQMLTKTDEYLAKFDGDQPIDTGFIPGLLLNTFGIGTEAIGELNADSIHSALLNLGITNLAPVTEQEFASVMKMWADISASPTANKGMLTAAKRRTERLMDTLRDEAIYNAGLVEEFGTEGQYGAFRRSNPFVEGLLSPPDQGGGSNSTNAPQVDEDIPTLDATPTRIWVPGQGWVNK